MTVSVTTALVFAIPIFATDAVTITVYRQTGFAGKAVRFPLFCNDLNIAALKNNSRYTFALPAGKYALSGKDKRWGAQITAVSGQHYYFRFEFAQDLILGHLALTLVPAQQGEYESARLKPADNKAERGKCGEAP